MRTSAKLAGPAHVFGLMLGCVAVLLTACATLPPAQPARDLASIVGVWEGTADVGTTRYGIKTTITADGRWENILSPAVPNLGSRFVGTVGVVDGKYRWKSETTGSTGTFALHEGEGKKVLVSTSDDGRARAELAPAKR
jgi:hypothetical protein